MVFKFVNLDDVDQQYIVKIAQLNLVERRGELDSQGKRAWRAYDKLVKKIESIDEIQLQ